MSDDFGEQPDLAAFLFVIGEHFVDLPEVVACNAIGNDMHGKARLHHVVARRFYAGGGIRACDEELVNAIRFDKACEFLACQGVALRLREDVIRYDFELGDQLLAFGARLESAGRGSDVVVLMGARIRVGLSI